MKDLYWYTLNHSKSPPSSYCFPPTHTHTQFPHLLSIMGSRAEPEQDGSRGVSLKPSLNRAREHNTTWTQHTLTKMRWWKRVPCYAFMNLNSHGDLFSATTKVATGNTANPPQAPRCEIQREKKPKKLLSLPEDNIQTKPFDLP